jgi:hypothetical protein
MEATKENLQALCDALLKPGTDYARKYDFWEVKTLCLDAMQFVLEAYRDGKPVEPKEFWKLKNLE